MELRRIAKASHKIHIQPVLEGESELSQRGATSSVQPTEEPSMSLPPEPVSAEQVDFEFDDLSSIHLSPGPGPVSPEPDFSSLPHSPSPQQFRFEPYLPSVEQRGWRTLPVLSRLRNIIWSTRFLALIHWLLTFAAVLTLLFSLVLHWWRVIRVDQQTLLLVMDNEKIHELSLNSTITRTRSQVVFWECFVDSPSDFGNFFLSEHTVKSINETVVRRRCHKILSGVKVNSSAPVQEKIIEHIKTQKTLGPIVIGFALLVIPFQAVADFSEKKRKLFVVLTPATRLLNVILCAVFVRCYVMINRYFQADNPAFPVSWPKEIRDVTTIETWQTGAVEWVFGMVIQVTAALLDLRWCYRDSQ